MVLLVGASRVWSQVLVCGLAMPDRPTVCLVLLPTPYPSHPDPSPPPGLHPAGTAARRARSGGPGGLPAGQGPGGVCVNRVWVNRRRGLGLVVWQIAVRGTHKRRLLWGEVLHMF